METSEKKSGNSWRSNLIPWAKDPRTITSESKKAGRERRRNWKKIMDLVLQYQSMTKDQLQKLAGDPNATMLELLMVKYITGWMKDTRMLIDFMDRHVPKAPTQMAIGWDEDNQTPINIQDYSKYSPEELAAMIKKFTTK